MYDLKPCPFCGSKDIRICGNKAYWIVCDACHCEGPSPTALWDTKVEAVDAWNERAEDAD